MTRLAAAAILLPLLAVGGASAARTLDIYFIDVEGGQATLILTPAGESILIDAGYAGRGGRGGRGGPQAGPQGLPQPGAGGSAPQGAPPDGPPAGAPVAQPATSAPAPPAGPPFAEPGRDPTRILSVLRAAGVAKLDFLLVTHFHPDHVGGVPELASKIPIGTFIDYGTPLGFDRMTAGGFRNYEPLRGERGHIEARPGDRLPFKGLEAEVVSAAGRILPTPLREGGGPNSTCAMTEDFPDDGTENFRSVGVMLRFGAFRFLDLGDLSGNTLTSLACPTDMLGQVSAYVIAHHGDYDSNVPALYAALRPQVSIMNNGPTKGGSPDTLTTIRAQHGMDLWQLHASRLPGANNAADPFLANVDDGITSYWLKLTASEDGSFVLVNQRTGFTKTYPKVEGRR